jgi:two-component system, response regulator PdtaR
MPDMSGIELSQKLQDGWNIPVLFLSAYCDEQTVADATAAGALGYIVKPVAVSQLMPALHVAQARAKDLDALLQNKVQLERVLGNNRDTSAAIGIMMERHNLSRQQAFEILRSKARSRGCRLETLAGELVEAEDARNLLIGLKPD